MSNMVKESRHFWGFALSEFSYFFIWAITYGFLTLWLEKVANVTGAQAGIIFSLMAGMSLIFQPIFGVVSDKLVFRKNLLLTISIAAILTGPYFQWLFMPLFNISPILVSVITGVFLAFVLNGGVSVIEQYVERASIANKFEYGHARMGGSVAGVVAAVVAGRLILWEPNSIWWATSVAAVFLTLLSVFSTKINFENAAAVMGDNKDEKMTKKDIFSIFKLRNFWILALFYMGASALFDVFDQQFIVFFKTFFETDAQGTMVYSYMTSAQTALELALMIPMPYIINKIGARNGLIIYGFLTCLRIVGSALSPSWIWIIFFRLLAGLEMPLLLVSIMKYIAEAFDIRLYATIYALASNFAKQISVFIFSSAAGSMYDSIGYQHTYLILGGIVFVITLIAATFLEKGQKLSTVKHSDDVETDVAEE
ncbi:oligosaccharide MFS transporter [Weissella thailandensis]|uniref:MFS transporter n=1 Tax=Weissella thailandensis TaxID=89061 RepID=A0ABX9I7A3_9LACO|nr:oligosaccharide MFS transporter [Weissella thailandensis]NKY90604.1 oligosaccharide MFS transporter [Weissella thailandensis]RDS59995.1 MFS transporter [Weissella thailandensis]GEP73910.1 MFS transporter [Weissella thailandensis]